MTGWVKGSAAWHEGEKVKNGRKKKPSSEREPESPLPRLFGDSGPALGLCCTEDI